MQFFEGKGYDKAFTENLWRIIRLVQDDPSMTIGLVSGCDDVCEACPNKEGEGCAFGNSVLLKDASAKKFLKIDVGTEAKAGDLMALVKDRLRGVNDMKDVCSECDWSGICNTHLSKMK